MTVKNPKSRLSGAYTFLRRLFCVPKCAACKARLNVYVDRNELNHGIPCFCPDCLAQWSRAKSELCHICGNSADRCTCMPRKNTFTQPTIPSLFFYHPETLTVQSRAIFTFKHKRCTELYDFMAEELAPKLGSLLDELEIEAEDCIFTYIPRTSRAIKKDGFDQSEIFTHKLCRKMGGECALPLLLRVGGKEQKRLDTAKRRKNAERALCANTAMRGMRGKYRSISLKALLSGRTVILIDDIITTGESVGRAIKLIKGAGAKTVIVASLARSEVRKK